MIDFLIFVLYIQNTKQLTYSEAETTASNICQNLYWTPHSRDERVQNICNTIWLETYE